MFLVYNKERIISCMVAIGTVFILFALSMTFMPDEATIVTSSTADKLIPIYCVDTEEKKVAITINCAWNADDIDLILETLKKNNIKITFFVVGDWVEKYEEALQKINENGHEIGNHTYNHPHVNNLSYEENLQQIQKCSDLVKSITGNATTLYRGPYGEYNNTVIQAAINRNHTSIQWNIDTLDWQGLTGEQMVGRINSKIDNGSIILMHNGTDNTALSLDMIIKEIVNKGYEIVKISDLIYKENYYINNNGIQKIIK